MGHLLRTAGGLCQKGYRPWGSALSFMGCFLGQERCWGTSLYEVISSACAGFGHRPLQAMTLSYIGGVTVPAYSIHFTSHVSPCLLMTFQNPEKLGH